MLSLVDIFKSLDLLFKVSRYITLKAMKAFRQLQKWPTRILVSMRQGRRIAIQPMGTTTPNPQMADLEVTEREEADSKVEAVVAEEDEGADRAGAIEKALEATNGVDVTRRRTWAVVNTSM
jgi:hypothetical protein